MKLTPEKLTRLRALWGEYKTMEAELTAQGVKLPYDGSQCLSAEQGRQLDEMTRLCLLIEVEVGLEVLIEAAMQPQAEQGAQERASFASGDTVLVGIELPEGINIGIHASEPYFANGVIIPRDHPAYRPAKQFVAALNQQAVN